MSYKMVSPEKIKSGTINPRQELGDLTELGYNMKKRQEEGKRAVIIPLMVKKIEEELFDYEIIDGKRRLQSALSQRIPKVPIVLETEISTPVDLIVMSLVSNEFRKDFNWTEKAMSYNNLHNMGLTYKEIGEMVGLSEHRVIEYVNTYTKWIAVEPRLAEVLEMETTKEIVNKSPEEDVSELVKYAHKNKISRDDIRKVLFALRNFYATIEVLKDFNPELYDELFKKYYPYRFNPQAYTLYEKEMKFKTGEAKLQDVFLPIANYPSEDSAIEYAKEHCGEVIAKTVSKEGWQLRCIPYTLAEIEVKFKELSE